VAVVGVVQVVVLVLLVLMAVQVVVVELDMLVVEVLQVVQEFLVKAIAVQLLFTLQVAAAVVQVQLHQLSEQVLVAKEVQVFAQ
jgi:hypothetical protein